jgi:hypothetical protein
MGIRVAMGRVMRGLAVLGIALALLQVGIAGYGAAAAGDPHGEPMYGPHQTVGLVLGLVSLLIAATALAARLSSRTVVLAVTLFLVAGLLQPSLVELGRDEGAWFGAVPAVCGVAILALLGNLVRPAAARLDAPARHPAARPTA